ncbi:MAG: helix-hairpin-helix domain-containing protein, partial [Vicinamibacterales bacterium]
MQRLQSAVGGKVWAAIIGGSLLGVLIFAVVVIWRGSRGETIILEVQPVDDPNVVRVYVGGEVANPGLFALPRGSRVADAIQAAGGPTTNGDTSSFGMAAPLEDADQIIVPARRISAAASTTQPFASGSAVATIPTAFGPVNINLAGVAELDTLPGIGPAISQRIIEYRETNGPFQSVDQLEEIAGISERMV